MKGIEAINAIAAKYQVHPPVVHPEYGCGIIAVPVFHLEAMKSRPSVSPSFSSVFVVRAPMRLP
jgi:hypothetical protein